MYRVKIELTAVDGHGVVKSLCELKRRMLADLTGHHGLLDVEYKVSGPGSCGLMCKVDDRGGMTADGEYPVGEEG